MRHRGIGVAQHVVARLDGQQGGLVGGRRDGDVVGGPAAGGRVPK